jgi:hypothetical protein
VRRLSVIAPSTSASVMHAATMMRSSQNQLPTVAGLGA